MIAAGTIMMARQMAETFVRTGQVFSKRGRIMPRVPRISEMPIKRIKDVGRPSTPV
jgi:hypothetical protein